MVHLTVLTFASAEYAQSAEVLRHSALRVGRADKVVIRTPEDPDVVAKLTGLGISPKERGCGFWAWKPFIIWQELLNVPDDGVLLYLDAATVVTGDLKEALLGDGDDSWDVRLFRLGEAVAKDYRNALWTKPSALRSLRATPEEAGAYQVNAAVQAYRQRPTKVAEAFVGTYWGQCTPEVLCDDPSFPDHRHDQSVLSVLAARNPQYVSLRRDPTQYGQRDDLLGGEKPCSPWLNHHRRQMVIPTVAVITPTIGSPFLEQAVASVAGQTMPGVQHWLVADGPRYADAVKEVAARFPNANVRVLVLPENVGAGGWNGHRVYGSLPHLVNTTHVAYLDEDNRWDEDHLAGIMSAMQSAKAPWGYSLRRIVSLTGDFVCEDRCESLGGISHTVCGKSDLLIDTNCYLLDRELAVEAGPLWNARFRDDRPGKEEPDRALAKALLTSAPHAVYRRHSVAYRLGSTHRSVQGDFFIQGNEVTGFDFSKPDLYIFHFNEEATRNFMRTRRLTNVSYALCEWQQTLLRGLDKHFNLIDGFENVPTIPPNARVYVSLCIPQQLPLEFLRTRTDLRRVVYTLESPNIRHSEQWDLKFLTAHFDVALTYWEPMFEHKRMPVVFCPHNTHHLDLDSTVDRAVLRRNHGTYRRSIVMCLEYRPWLKGGFSVNGMELNCLDPVRAELVTDLRDLVVVGKGWDKFPGLHSGMTVASAVARDSDTRHAVDWYQGHTFALIVENVDAEGYVSEKLYDALIAGAIPLYWGNLSWRLLDLIPELADLVINITGKTSADIQCIVDRMSEEAIQDFRNKVYNQRINVLRKVGTQAFADAVLNAL